MAGYMASPSEGVVIVDPSQELRFKGPFHTDVSSTSLRITNTSSRRITFKIKTTAPKHYCVRPNQGIIEPSATVGVTVMLQPFEYDPAEKNKHKFMVQTMYVPAEHGDVDLEGLWKNASAESVMTSNKLRSVFEIPAADTATIDKVTPEAKTSKGVVGGASDELKRIKDEMMTLKAENVQLKEDASRLRRSQRGVTDTTSLASSAASSAAALDQRFLTSSQASTAPPADPMMYYVLAVVALVVGVIFGKLF